MKAISEYFRDLAERDRFFGAEPPQPDAEYLHRIAEQTIKSRVEAEVSDNSLILRQEQDNANTAPVVAPAVAAAAAPVAAPEPALVAQPETAAFVEPVIADRTGFGEGDTIAEKLQRIRAVVSRENAEPAEATSFYNEDEHADEFATSDPVDPPASFAADEASEDEAYQDEAEDADANILGSIMADIGEDAAEEAPAEAVSEDAAEAEVADVAEADVEDTAAEEVEAEAETVAETAIEEDVTADAAEAEVEAEAVVDEAVAETASDEAEASEAVAEDVVAEAEAEDAVAEDDSADVADVLAPVVKPRRRIIVQKISRAEVEAAQTGADVDASEEPSAELDPDAEAALMAELAEVEAEMGTAQDTTEDAATQEDTAAAEMEARALAAAQAAQDQADAEAAARKQAETEAAEAEAAAAKADADAKAAEDADALAKVMAEAAEVEAEATSDVEDVAEDLAEDQAEAASEEDDTADENRAARIARRALMVEDEDEALNRLMDATSTRLSDDDEGAVRRASIAHLKAAVAATKADDSIAKAAADEEERELDQYRDDLARVVRPGRARPRADGAATSRPAPLVLVSEQRIDTPAPQADAVAAADVRPRRITSGNLALAEDLDEEVDENLFEDANVESFSSYAERNDALELPDLLEAAAAHYAFVEGSEEFTRPMLMRKIASLTTGEAPSREAGLRSFGSLLREGKVVKSGNGKFVLSSKSRFTPEAREAGD